MSYDFSWSAVDCVESAREPRPPPTPPSSWTASPAQSSSTEFRYTKYEHIDHVPLIMCHVPFITSVPAHHLTDPGDVCIIHYATFLKV